MFYGEKRLEIREIIRNNKNTMSMEGSRDNRRRGMSGSHTFTFRNRELWCKGYYVDTTGKYTIVIKRYIKNQLKVDRESDQLSIYDPRDPFTGSE